MKLNCFFISIITSCISFYDIVEYIEISQIAIYGVLTFIKMLAFISLVGVLL